MEHTLYHTTLHVVEIVNVTRLDSIGEKSETWIWEIIIADQGTTYKGKATESRKNQFIDWVELKSVQPLSEMIDIYKKKVSDNS
ncbi:hypothetical protein [Paenibacillus pabuli]|uniref:hypothetical protein n=1 Tax=Paenibacillus pabuli TaxID=1472 RepID=UPI001FFE9334|nr:hypothetical protein [Paenibacillus pabuli]UPK43219.1 hypothetical protein KET34_29645 [Paenibacillus pabuli]